MSGKGRGRVKRRSPTIIEQFTVAAQATEWRIFWILYPKSNRIACFRKGGEFSHGLGQQCALRDATRDGSIAPTPAVRGTEIERQGSTQSGPSACLPGYPRLRSGS